MQGSIVAEEFSPTKKYASHHNSTFSSGKVQAALDEFTKMELDKRLREGNLTAKGQ